MTKSFNFSLSLATLVIFIQNSFASFNGFSRDKDVRGGDQYKSRAEEKAEKLGSLFDRKSINFMPQIVKNNLAECSIDKVNKYLWQASIESLNNYSIISADINKGIIKTDWFKANNNLTKYFKIILSIKGEMISSDSVEISVIEKSLKNGSLSNAQQDNELIPTLEGQILTKARELFITNQKNTK